MVRTEHRSRGAREVALLALHRVETDGSYADRVLDSLLGETDLPKRDRALATELTYGTLRWRGRIDWILNRLVKGGIERLTPWVRNILRLGAYQLLFCERIPAFAAVSESVELAKVYGHSGVAKLVNGVLRRVGRSSIHPPSARRVEDLAVSLSHPSWLVARWVSRFGTEEAERLLEADNEVPPISVRSNTLRVSREKLEEMLAEEGFSPTPGRFSPSSVHIEGDPSSSQAYCKGLFQVQDEGATLVGGLLDPQPGELVVDLCSAPGGKTTHLAELMENRGLVVAVELKPWRLKLVLENCERLGIGIVKGVVADGRRFCLRREADRVLVDVPCSNLGVLRRRVDLRWRMREEEIGELARLQSELLEGGASLVRKGGVLVYSTCSLEPEENEEVVSGFLRSHPQFVLEDGKPWAPEEVVRNGCLRTYPHLHGLDGGFAARMKRTS